LVLEFPVGPFLCVHLCPAVHRSPMDTLCLTKHLSAQYPWLAK
jgi:hypothetical protein